MNKKVKELMETYTLEQLATMLYENLTILDNIADQFGAEFLMEFVGEEE